jgi:hypothetical protein
LILPLLTACSAGKDGEGASPLGPKDTGIGVGDDGIQLDDGLQVDGDKPETPVLPGCAEATTFVYVLDDASNLYKFDPKINTKAAFTKIGKVGCAGSPNSMAVARDGIAYVDMADSSDKLTSLAMVDITNASCKGSAKFDQASGYGRFGMGYSTDTAGSTTETLFIGDTSASKMAKLDPASGAVTPIGTLPGSGPEFTGNALGELWAFMPQTSPAKVAQIDKTTGKAIQSFNLPGLPASPSAWAFAFWGGDYYIFLMSALDTSTSVYKFSTTTKTAPKYIANIGIRIVGAGVSTCAPTVIQ